MHPSMTQIILPDGAPAYAGIGSPKALIESAKGGDAIVSGLGLILQATTEPGDEVVVFPPAYHAFRKIITANERTILDLVSKPRGESNVDHFCLVVEPLDWQDVIDSGVFTVLEGPVGRSGARGDATSIYVADPDGNSIELRWYPQDQA